MDGKWNLIEKQSSYCNYGFCLYELENHGSQACFCDTPDSVVSQKLWNLMKIWKQPYASHSDCGESVLSF